MTDTPPNDSDPLRSLLVDASEVDRQAIASTLSGKVSLDGETGRPVLTPGYASLDAASKVLLILLARKAALLLELAENEVLSNKEVIDQSGLPAGTVAPTLRRFKELHLVDQDTNRSYYIPNAQLNQVIEKIVKGGDS